MVTMEQFKHGADLFFTQDIFPKLPEIKRFVAAFGVALILGNIEHQPFIRDMGLVSEDGMVDVERAYAAAKSAISIAPLVINIPKFGEMRFREQDIERLYQFIMS